MNDVEMARLLGDPEELAQRLVEKGLGHEASRGKAALFAAAAAGIPPHAEAGQPADVSLLFVPGRIEVLGKHTDYAGGRSMVAAIEHGFCAVCRPRDDRHVSVTDAIQRQQICFELGPDLVVDSGHWSNYPMTVARRLARNFPDARRGVDLAFASDLPAAAGMSSSSAMIVMTFLAIAEANRLDGVPLFQEHLGIPIALAGYLGTVENGHSFGPLTGDRGVGTFGGSEDHTAILCSQPGRISQYAYSPVRFEKSLPVPARYAFAIGVTGVIAEKTGDALEKYNAASRLVQRLTDLWRQHTGRDDPHLAAALEGSEDAAERIRLIVSQTKPSEPEASALLARLEHFLNENVEIIPAASAALERGDLATFGMLVDRSQYAAERLLGNQVPETVLLAATARQHGAVAASAFGAGFGGSVWALVHADNAASFLDDWAAAYRRQFPQHAKASSFFLSAAGPGAFRVN